ncbi:flagellar biosynthetic protein FliO [Aquisalibacillus elongatus]|uniref:Flagellar protein FliO/FliZ n=1 Tax=Aquisalibacillus elongatus TaxID=485577 RepID=A0A3N5BE38_9BACI|nr:flagellar biosynthetic protein FliO [Aquisalibacillus elongatus]RPF55984.1 flagellar protein FliO/FliZ [Aquisalibacillus elongatus]
MKIMVKSLLSTMVLALCLVVSPIHADESEPVSEKFNEQPNEQEESNNNEENTQANEQEEVSLQNDQSLFWDFVKMVLALVFVLGLIYVLLKFIQKRSRIYQQSRSLVNIGGLSLGANKSVQIIKVGEQYFLVGVGEDVQLLTEIKDSETIEKLMNQEDSDQKMSSFQNILDTFQRKKQNPYQQQETKRQFQAELESMKNTRERLTKRYHNRDDDPNG